MFQQHRNRCGYQSDIKTTDQLLNDLLSNTKSLILSFDLIIVESYFIVKQNKASFQIISFIALLMTFKFTDH